MVRVRIYTKTGDKGETGLLGGIRVPKDNPRVEAYGSIDEMNSALGVVKSLVDDKELKDILTGIQNDLFTIGAELASPQGRAGGVDVPQIEEKDVEKLERIIDKLEDRLKPLTRFILPEGTTIASFLHFARAVSRRAERRIVTLSRQEEINARIIPYINRLSDLLFVMARTMNQRSDIQETVWDTTKQMN